MPPRASTSKLDSDSPAPKRQGRQPSKTPAPPAANNQAHPRLIQQVIYADYAITPPYPSPYPFEDSAISTAASSTSLSTLAPKAGANSAVPAHKPHGNSKEAKAEKARLAALAAGLPPPTPPASKSTSTSTAAPTSTTGVKSEAATAVGVNGSAPLAALGEPQTLPAPDSALPAHPPSEAATQQAAEQAKLLGNAQQVVQQQAGRDVGGKGKGKKGEAVNGGGGAKEFKGKVTPRLFVCHGCFKYCLNEAGMNAHKRECTFKHPPGRKVYQRGAHIIWEVDGSLSKLYCQNLCLFGKLFIEHKYQFFDLDGFLFYVLTDATPSFDYPLAYFSKEKVSYDDYNLACIVTFPPFQKKNYGTLLIEFSYEISRRGPTVGTPERPLSRLGLASYQAYWTACIVKYLRQVFNLRGEPPATSVKAAAAAAGPRIVLKGRHSSAAPGSPAHPAPAENDLGPDQIAHATAAAVTPTPSTPLTVDRNGDGDPSPAKKRQRKGGWAGEQLGYQRPLEEGEAPLSLAATTSTNGLVKAEDSTHQTTTKDYVDSFELPSSLEELSKRVGLRMEDVAYAMVESGLAQWRREDDEVLVGGDLKAEGGGGGEKGQGRLELCITPELVESVARERRVRPAIMEQCYVLL